MKTIKELEAKKGMLIKCSNYQECVDSFNMRIEVLKDVVKLIDEKHKEAKDMCTCVDDVDGFVLRDDEVDEIFEELKKRITG